jgi:hypothetical protein
VTHVLATLPTPSRRSVHSPARAPARQVWRPAEGFGIRLDGGNSYAGSVISPYYDSMLMKVTGSALTFSDTAAKVSRALRESRIRGVKTNIPCARRAAPPPRARASRARARARSASRSARILPCPGCAMGPCARAALPFLFLTLALERGDLESREDADAKNCRTPRSPRGPAHRSRSFMLNVLKNPVFLTGTVTTSFIADEVTQPTAAAL